MGFDETTTDQYVVKRGDVRNRICVRREPLVDDIGKSNVSVALPGTQTLLAHTAIDLSDDPTTPRLAPPQAQAVR